MNSIQFNHQTVKLVEFAHSQIIGSFGSDNRKQHSTINWTTAAVAKWKLFPATEDARKASLRGITGTPMAIAVFAVTGNPKLASLSRAVR